MKVTFINGSPKAGGSASGVIITEMVKLLHSGVGTASVKAMKYVGHYDDILSDVMVPVFPLYCDAVPSHLMRFLDELEAHCHNLKEKPLVYAIVNCGFYESAQCKPALDVIKNWAGMAGFDWGGGLGIGGGGMITIENIPMGKGPKKNMGKALQLLADRISHMKKGDNNHVDMNFPRFLYIWAAHSGWKKEAKKNNTQLGKMY